MTQIIVRAVRERAEMVEYLQRHIPDLRVVWDERRDGFDTLDRALELAGELPAVHIEEDILLTEGFREKLEAEIAERPETPIQFFSMRGADLRIGSRYDRGRNYLMFQCTYLPQRMSANFREFAQCWNIGHPEHPGGMDLALRDFFVERRIGYWLHCPSLVDHRVGRSMLSPRSSTRTSLTFESPLA